MTQLERLIRNYRYHSGEAARFATEIARYVERAAPDTDPLRVQPDVLLTVSMVATHYHVPPQIILSRSRQSHIALARQVAMVLLRRCTALSVRSIADAFQRDHGTVLHAERAIADRAFSDAHFAARLKTLEAELLEALPPSKAVA